MLSIGFTAGGSGPTCESDSFAGSARKKKPSNRCPRNIQPSLQGVSVQTSEYMTSPHHTCTTGYSLITWAHLFPAKVVPKGSLF